MSRLITTSLIGAIDWASNAPYSLIKGTTTTWEQDALRQLVEEITRTKRWEPSPAVQLGIDFEKAVYRNIDVPKEQVQASDIFKDVLDLCRGGKVQQKIKKYVNIDGEKYCLFGKTDILFPDEILDIKTTSTEKNKPWQLESKYLNTFQHDLYCFITGIKKFKYVVVVFKKGINVPISMYTFPVTYWYTEEQFYDRIAHRIRRSLETLKSFNSRVPEVDLWEAYLTRFSLYNN